MFRLELGPGRKRLRLMCLGAHSDDLELGCGGTLLQWLRDYQEVDITWVVLSAGGTRADEARASAHALLKDASRLEIVLGDFRDAHLPGDYARLKSFFGDIRSHAEADVILTHRIEDRHQDHRLVGELTWQTWRRHLILEYEIPKYEGDLGQPNLYVPLAAGLAERKTRHLLEHFQTQRAKSWFSAETFSALMRLRGIECHAESGLAEAFHARKLVV
ncbi:MAG: PIG-L family deacetylase [Zoogloea sp.]|nr:PIG-L family deacetylase [Zoogloea sp.]